MATKTAEGVPGTLKHQTWTLKVPIHCGGCERKVKRILRGVVGVFTISVDSQLHKVTVIGDVDSETLIKKLVRSGKHAELWPEKNEKKPGKSKKKDGDSNKDSQDGGDQGAAKGKANEKSDKLAENESPIDSKDSDDGGENNSLETDGEAGDSKPAGGGGGGGNGGGKQKKKKKKKGQNVNAEACKDAPTGSQPHTASADAVPASASASSNISPPDRMTNAFPPLPHAHHYVPPMYGLSYSSANPSAGTSHYYASPMNHHHHSCFYSHQVGPYPPPEPIQTYHDADNDPYYDDDDEGGCSIV